MTSSVTPTISLCIPTYKRSSCLRTLLESVSTQNPAFDEVIIGDDASGDGTREVVESFRGKIPFLKYYQSSNNVGLDQNFRKVVELAQSDYVWFMGDDDRLRPSAVAAAHAALERYPDLTGITFGSVDFDSELHHPVGLKPSSPSHVVQGAANLFSDHVDMLGFMSTTVVSRLAWNAVPTNSVGQFDNLYSQVHRIGLMLGENGNWLISQDLTVDYRSNNDQFKVSLGGELERMMRDVTSYDDVISDLFSQNHIARHAACGRVLRTHIMSRIRNAKTDTSQFNSLEALNRLLKYYFRQSFFWLVVAPTLLLPRPIVRFAKRQYQRRSKRSGASRARELLESSAHVRGF